LIESIREADIVVNCLGSNPSTIGLLDKSFFFSMKKGSYFITITSNKIYDIKALKEALNKCHLASAATDCGSIDVCNSYDQYYIDLLDNPKILATPHIAARTEVTDKIANDMMIDNIEKYISGTPINLYD
jgi:glycerate dehydrogenase